MSLEEAKKRMFEAEKFSDLTNQEAHDLKFAYYLDFLSREEDDRFQYLIEHAGINEPQKWKDFKDGIDFF